MKHVYSTFLLLIFLSVSTVTQAQITITESYFEDRIGITETSTLFDLVDTSDLTAIINATGPNQTWDFSGFMVADTFTIEQTYIQLPATDIPGADLFPDSDFVVRLESDTVDAVAGQEVASYLFSSIEDGFFISEGSFTLGDVDEDGAVDTLVFTFSPATIESPVPLSYEDMWEDSTTTTLSFGGFDFPPSTASINSSVVDGWGTLVLPQGSFEALRIRTEFTTVNLTGGPDMFDNTDIEFVTREGALASIFIGADGTVEGSFSISDFVMSGTPVEDEEGLPSQFQLSQNYPNPFNPSTTINYALPASSDVTLKVYTLTGQEVATLVNATQGVGQYEVQFDASNLSSGIYLYRLETASFTETRMMSLIK